MIFIQLCFYTLLAGLSFVMLRMAHRLAKEQLATLSADSSPVGGSQATNK
jgi:hypothetical protein